MKKKTGIFLHSNRMLPTAQRPSAPGSSASSRPPPRLPVLKGGIQASPAKRSGHDLDLNEPHSLNGHSTPESILHYLTRELAYLKQDSPMKDKEDKKDDDLVVYQSMHVYREAMHLVIASLPSYSVVLDTIQGGYDTFIEHLEKKDDSVAMAKSKAYDEFRVIFDQQERRRAHEHETMLSKLRQSEEEIEGRHKDHVDQLQALVAQNDKLRAQGQDDHDRCLVLAQSVVELRLALQRSEHKIKECDDLTLRVNDLSQKLIDVARDYTSALREMKKAHVNFTMGLRQDYILMLQDPVMLLQTPGIASVPPPSLDLHGDGKAMSSFGGRSVSPATKS